MANEKYKQIMKEKWQDARKIYHYPQLPQPKLVENEDNGSINMESLEVKVSEPFIETLEEKGISPEESFSEVLTHELTHFMKFPGSVLNVLRLQKAGQGIADKSKINSLRYAFTEAQTNLYQLNELKSKTAAKVRKAYGLEEGDNFGKLMYGLYQEVSGQDLGVDFKNMGLVGKVKGALGKVFDKEKDLIGKLKNIDYTNKDNEIVNFRNFANILKDYEIKDNKGNKGMNGSGSGNGLKEFSDNQIREGLKQFASECENPGEFEEVVEQVLGKGSKKKESKSGEEKALGKHAGVGQGITELAQNFYTALAEMYTIPIKKKQMKKSGSLYPYSHSSFEMGDPITDVDAFSTPGILPGITKKWVRKEGYSYGNEKSVPDSFILMDNSPSMFESADFSDVISPSEKIYNHIVGATAISNAYLSNGSRVGIYSFGSMDHLTNPIKDRGIVHRELRRYSKNGGTTFNARFLENVLKDSEKQYDLSIISDMDISNLDDFVQTISKIPKTNRIHIFYTENNSYVEKLRNKFGNRENIGILPLINRSDIERITMGELTKSIK